jgi:hypothetical protein
MVGRPRIFVTPAEKQKAYRERKRQAVALRNYPDSEREQIDPPELDEVAVLKAESDRIGKLHKEHIGNFYQVTVIEDRYDWWRKRAFELEEQWWAAHQQYWQAKRANGTLRGAFDS